MVRGGTVSGETLIAARDIKRAANRGENAGPFRAPTERDKIRIKQIKTLYEQI